MRPHELLASADWRMTSRPIAAARPAGERDWLIDETLDAPLQIHVQRDRRVDPRAELARLIGLLGAEDVERLLDLARRFTK